ncbi:helix-turn-helix domain-containing protein [Pseudomonas sp. MBLB4123]|uniref:helix-turn-helix domain-containing protein n=1 Tax=Pseudomonas sp. MBLB4123 TaxID=3451557 RepID=UPI003F754FC9
MQIQIDKPETIGMVIRASRKAMDMRQDDAAGSIGVSENFLGKVERGGESVHWGKLFQVMRELGLHLYVDVPDEVAEQTRQNLEKLLEKAEQQHTAQK